MALARRKEAATMTPPAAVTTRQATVPKPKRKRAPNRTPRPAASAPTGMPPIHPTLDRALRELLHRVDFPDAEILTYDDLHYWGDEAAAAFVSAGIVVPAGIATEISCPECGDGTMVRVERAGIGDPVMATCWGGGEPHMPRVTIERTRLWRFNLEGMARLIANRTGASGRVEVPQPDRLVVAGSTKFRGATHELFLARGAAWPDARATIASAERLQQSALPILLSVSRVAPLDTWLPMRPIAASVGLVLRWTSDGVSVDLDALVESESVPHPSARQASWLTVSQAAELLCDVRSGVSLARARARVSRAAGDGRLRTNGEKGSTRRIHNASLSLWLQGERTKDLREADDW